MPDEPLHHPVTVQAARVVTETVPVLLLPLTGSGHHPPDVSAVLETEPQPELGLPAVLDGLFVVIPRVVLVTFNHVRPGLVGP